MTTSDRARAGAATLRLALPALAYARPAAAQGQDEAAARALFSDGRRLVKAGRYEEACSKFEAAKKLYTSSGLLLNLADCHEHIHRTASAWAEFGDAAFAASGTGRGGDEAEAKKRQAALEGKLSRVSIRVAAPAPDETVQRDGTAVDRAAWDSAIPVDPGDHVVAAEAPGRTPWSTTVSVTEPGKTVTVDVPALVEVPRAEAKPTTTPAENGAAGGGAETSAAASPGKGQRVLGIVISGVGVVGMGVSAALGLMAKSQFDSAASESGPVRHTDSVAAGNLADVGTVVVVAGAVVTAVGAVVWLTAPKGPVAVGTNGSAVFLSGSF
jgi:hypothetical protein